jgi:UDP-N-acetylmuramoyl-tripeptide--D-alanyl-D-alanine ligase
VTLVWVVFGLALVPWAALTFVRLKRFLHILQLEEYLTPQYFRWAWHNRGRYLRLSYLALAVGGLAIALGLLSFGNDAVAAVGAGAWLVAAVAVLGTQYRSTTIAKKPLVLTARARRILLAAAAWCVILIAVGVGLGLLGGSRTGVALGMIVATLVATLGCYPILLANLTLWPFEEMSRRRFQGMAAAELARQRPRIIAITGSAGKTTTKELVAHLLSAKYRVLKTPASFNTPLGIARTVNDSLRGQEYFVVEMGAYKRGEIAKLCRLVDGPDISVITTVNAQHLERFGSLEATAEAKFEIVGGLKEGGTAVLNFDVEAIRGRAAAYGGIRLISFGVESEEAELRGRNVVETENGLEFYVQFGGETAHVVTQLLARHNATNVLAAMGVGLSCGLELGYMAAAIRQFRPPEHRLAPMQAANGVTVLDDAYNANPEGIIGAIEVLGRYAPRRRILVTPGLIEMGKEKAAYHARIGKAAAANADVAFLVGPKQTADIKAAMVEASFPGPSLHVVRGLGEARETLAKIGAPGDVILYANDLPDQFDEELRI